MPNYSFIVPQSYSPFTFQEMLTPYATYKEEEQKLEDTSLALQKEADKFKYLSENLPEDSKARQIYEGYSNQLNGYVDDIMKRGLTMGTRRGLTSMKRRYSGEIGRLDEAQTALEKEKELRRQMGLKDSSMLYAVDNLSIDNFLDKNTPNLYGISGNELYTRGAAAGKAASSRVYGAGDGGRTLGGYYRDWVERMGYDASSMAAFRESLDNIPELRDQVNAILKERGVSQNLTGVSLERAREAVINGMIDGAVYQEKHNPVRDAGVLDAYQDAQVKHQTWAETRQEKEDSKDNWKYTWDGDGNATGYSPAFIRATNQMNKNKKGGTSGSSGKMSGLGNSVLLTSKKKDGKWVYSKKNMTEEERNTFKGQSYTYDQLSSAWKAEINKQIQDDSPSKYTYTYNEDEGLMIEPNKRYSENEEDNEGNYDQSGL